MSRPSTGRPEFRLRFGYPNIVLESPDGRVQSLCIAQGSPKAAFRALASEIARRNGRLTAILPEAEIWHSRMIGVDAASARRTAASALGTAPEDLALRFGPKAPDGAHSAVATRRSTLRDAHDYLARAGLRPHRITAPLPQAGFGAPPAFLVPVPLRRRAVTAAGLAAFLAVLFAGWAALGPADETSPLRAALPEPAFPAEAHPVPALPPAVPARLETTPLDAPVLPPAPRPDRLPPLRQAATAAPPAPALLPIAASARNPLGVPAPHFTALAPPRARPSELAPDRLTPATASARTAPAHFAPLPRPAAPAATAVVATRPDAPRPRPATPASVDSLVATLGAAIAAPATAAVLRPAAAPQPRPAQPVSVQVASLDPGTAFALAPALRPEPRRLKAPAAPVAAPPPQKPAAAPARPAAAPVAAEPPRATAPRPLQVAPAAAAPVQVVRAVPAQPARVIRPAAPVAAAPQPARSPRVVVAPAAPAAAPAQPRREEPKAPALNRNALALIGVFGNAKGRHALVLLPNGQTQRVKPGDQIQGIQVTAIAADAVHLRAQGRDAVIRLPE